jgi:hypothetical protein
MSSPELGSSAQSGATVEGGDVFRARLSDIKRYAEIDARYDLATLSGVREINNELPPPPYSAGDSTTQTEISEELLKVQSRAETDERDDLATLSGVREINNELPPPPYSTGDTATQTEISEQLSKIQSRARYDQMDHLASLRDMTQVEQLTERGVPGADDRQARITARTTEIRERLQGERDASEANTAGREADDFGHSLSLPGY